MRVFFGSFSDLTPFFGVGAFGAAGGGVELVADPGAETFWVGGADPGGFFFGVGEKLYFRGHVFSGVGVAGVERRDDFFGGAIFCVHFVVFCGFCALVWFVFWVVSIVVCPSNIDGVFS